MTAMNEVEIMRNKTVIERVMKGHHWNKLFLAKESWKAIQER